MSKVYFPRILVPIAGVAVFLVDLVISLRTLRPHSALLRCHAELDDHLCSPCWLRLTFVATLSLGLLFAALMVFYRDFQYFVPFLSQFLMFVTPVVYPLSLIRNPTYRWIMSINPMFGIVPAFRSAILGVEWDLLAPGDILGERANAIVYIRRFLLPEDGASIR